MKNFLNRLFGSAPAAPSIQQQLAAAVNANDAATVAALLAQGAQPDVPDAPHGWTATQRAAANGRGQILQLLLQHGADVHQRSTSLNQSLLHLAASGMQSEVMELLLEAGLEVNGRDDLQQTPLHLAAGLNDAAGAQLLLVLGADQTLTNHAGHTPAEHARQRETDLHNPWSTKEARNILRYYELGLHNRRRS